MKALFCGLGGVGQRHLRNIRVLVPDIEILAYRTRGAKHVLTPNMEIAEGNIETGIEVYDDIYHALSRRPDIAIISNPTCLHVRTAIICCGYGCDVLIEKPVSDRMDHLEKAFEECSQLIMVGYQMRFHPALQQLRQTLTEVGNLLSLRVTVGDYLPSWHPYEDYRQMYASRADQGGGVVLSQIHEFDYLYSIFGLPRKIFSIGGHWSDLEIDVEDTCDTLMEFEWQGKALPVSVHQDFLVRQRTCEVIGDKGREIIDFNTGDRNQMFLDEMTHFLECVRTRRKPVCSLEDGLQSLRMALAVKKSMKEGVVELF